MNQSIAAVETFLDEHGIRHDQLDDHTLHADIGGENGLFPAFLDIDDEQGRLLVITICPANVPQGRRSAVVELLMRINWKLVLGSFEMDMEDGQIRFRTSIMLSQGGLNEEAITHVVLANLTLMDHHLPDINAVAFGSISPKSALQQVRDSRATTSEGSQLRLPANRLRGFFDASNN